MAVYSDLTHTQESTGGIVSTAACVLSEGQTVIYHLIENKIKTVMEDSTTILSASYSIILMKLTVDSGACRIEPAQALAVTRCPVKANELFELLVRNIVTPYALEDVLDDWEED